MAQKFSGAARARGFKPIQVSDASIRRMREENERILEGMRARQESIRANDERQLQAMQEDANYYAKVRNRDFNIADTNIKSRRQQAEYDAAAREAEINQQTEALDTLFSGLAKFSSTMAATQAEKKRKKTQKKKENDAVAATLFPNRDWAQAQHDYGIMAESTGRVGVANTLAEAEALGAPAYDVSKSRLLNIQESAGARQQIYKQKAETGFKSHVKEYFEENPDALTPEGAKGAWGDIVLSFLVKEGIPLDNVEMLMPMAKVVHTEMVGLINGLESKQTEENNAETRRLAMNAALSDFEGQGFTSFNEIRKMDGNPAALDMIKELATFQDENGEFPIGDSWKTFSVFQDGKPFYTGDPKNPGTHEKRGIEIQNIIADKRREWNRNQNTTERQQYQEESKAWHRHIVEGNNIQDIGAAYESFRDNVQGAPEWLRKLKHAGNPSSGSYNANLITMAKDMQARGMLYQDLVNKVNERDPELGNKLQESLDKQDPFSRNDMYKEYMDTIDKLPMKQIGGTDLYPEPNSDAIKASAKLKKVYQQLVRRGVADGASIADASYTALNTIESGFKVEGGPFHRVYNANTGFYEFAELHKKTPKEIAQALDEADTQFLRNLDAGHNKVNLKKSMFAQPEIVLTSDQYDQQIVDMNSPGFTFHPRIDMLVQSGAVGSHMEALALVGEAQGKPAIVPPPSLRTVTEYSSEAKALLAKYGSTNRDARGHGMGISTVGTGWNEGLVPATLREFYRASAERHGISPAENSAMGEIESAHNTANVNPETGMSVSYNGTSEGPMQINRSAHKPFFDQHNGNPSVEANIDYGTAYYASLKQQYNNDPIVAAMAYNGGPGNYELWLNDKKPDWVKTSADEKEWQRIVNEMTGHGQKFAKAYYKYSGDASLLQHPILLRN